MSRLALIVATAMLALPAAGCGGSPNSGVAELGSTTTNSAQANGPVAFSSCMRSNGVPRFPEPAGGAIPKIDLEQLGVSSSQFQSAQTACRHLLPGGGASTSAASVQICLSTGDCAPAVRQQLMSGMLTFAGCMRSHGVSNWPDPTRDPDNGAPVFNLVAVPGTDWSSSPIERKLSVCQQPGVRIALRRP